VSAFIAHAFCLVGEHCCCLLRICYAGRLGQSEANTIGVEKVPMTLLFVKCAFSCLALNQLNTTYYLLIQKL